MAKQLSEFDIRLLRYIAQQVGLTRHHASGVTRAFIVSVGRLALRHFRDVDTQNPNIVVWDDKEFHIGGQADERRRQLTGDRLRAYQRAEYFVRRYGSKVRHIIDWLEVAVREDHAWLSNVDERGRPKKLMKCGSIKQLFDEAEKQLRIVAQRQRQAAEVDDEFTLTSTDIKWTAQLADDFYLVQLLSPEALDAESARMGHCIGLGSYDDRVSGDQRRWSYWSVRNSDGVPLATIEVREGIVRQLAGRGNSHVSRTIREVVESHMESVGWTYTATEEFDVEAWQDRMRLQTDYWRLERLLGRKPELDDIRRFAGLPEQDKRIIVGHLRELAGFGPDDDVPRPHDPSTEVMFDGDEFVERIIDEADVDDGAMRPGGP